MSEGKYKVRTCVDCGCDIRSTGFKRSIKETRCRSCSRTGERHHRWNGGEKTSHGYVYVKKPDHPYACKNGYIHRSHLVWESANGGFVQRGEIIHHIDGSRDNDAIENLQLMTRSEHMSLHMTGKTGKANANYKHGGYVGERARRKKKQQ